MIKYTLKCSAEHNFESWFQSAEAYEKLCKGGFVACMTCGDTDVSKAIMAPRVRPARDAVGVPHNAEQPPAALSAPTSEGEVALREMRRKVEESSDYVGDSFAKQAREMHLGEAPERAIYGTAGFEDAKALIDDGVPVMPLPFVPKVKAN